jgi:DNA repair protein RAD50
MSSIEKLLIRGIRSFNPDEPAVIEFYSPVTLIVGHNGAGKTTIIECLKYATTGDLPPNSKGGAFVHDPKLLTNENIVKAQVKLKFRNLKGLPMVVTRSIQLSTKNKKSELKTLEGLLVTNDPATGEQISISSRVADLDAEVPLHLGVSRAVLENVIFCHQEESLWPLSEPSVLKKKFDDIFAATRYTKALDILKNLKKQLSADLKVEQQKLEHCRSDKEKAMRVATSAEAARNKLAEVSGRISALQGQIESCNIRIQQMNEDIRATNGVYSEFDKVSHELSVLNSSIVELENSGMKILSESDEQLALTLGQHVHVSSKADGDLSTLQANKEQLICALSALSADETSKQIQLGTAKATLSEYQKRWTNFSSRFPSEQVSRSNLMQVQSKLSEESVKSKRALNQIESLFNDQNNLLNSQKNSLFLKKNSLEESRKHQRKLADDQRNKLSDILMRQSNLSSCGGPTIEELQTQIFTEEIGRAHV